MLHNHTGEYAGIVRLFPSKKEDRIKDVNYVSVVREMFKDMKVNRHRIKTVYAFALYLQELYDISMLLKQHQCWKSSFMVGLKKKGDKETSYFPYNNMPPHLEWGKCSALILLCRKLNRCDNDDDIDCFTL
jgi:hypothetical protein